MKSIGKLFSLLGDKKEQQPVIGQKRVENNRLAQIAKLGESITTIFDCGAFIGRWAQEVSSLFPDANMILIEPNPELQSEIEMRIEPFKERVTLIPVAVGSKEGSAELNVWKNSKHSNKLTALAASSLLPHVQGEPSNKFSVTVKTLDQIALETERQPDLIKLDLQGFEKDALIGAKSVLQDAKIVITEFGCLQAYEHRTQPKELFEILSPYGFSLYDIVDLRYRPYDNALAGGDFIFVKKDSVLWTHKDYF